jgi:hypothetical protein
MIDSIQVDTDENVFYFDTFELVFHTSGNYLLCDEGYFGIDGLENFIKSDKDDFDGYLLINEFDKKYITVEDFEKIKELYIKYA